MIEVKKTEQFSKWLDKLKDRKAKFSIVTRIFRMENGNFGDVKPTSEGKIKEMRVDVGKGYRVYYAQKSQTVILLLNGGDKKSQSKDIKQAKQILDTYEVNDES